MYYLQFLDHVKDSKMWVNCEVIGWVVKEDEHSVVIAYWRTESNDDIDGEENSEYMTILKKVIKKAKLIKVPSLVVEA